MVCVHFGRFSQTPVDSWGTSLAPMLLCSFATSARLSNSPARSGADPRHNCDRKRLRENPVGKFRLTMLPLLSGASPIAPDRLAVEALMKHGASLGCAVNCRCVEHGRQHDHGHIVSVAAWFPRAAYVEWMAALRASSGRRHCGDRRRRPGHGHDASGRRVTVPRGQCAGKRSTTEGCRALGYRATRRPGRGAGLPVMAGNGR